MEKVRYEEMLPHEIVARRRKFPAAFIGLGGLEWHGEHLAVGNDALKAEKLCELAAAKSGGFAFPTLWYGDPRVAGARFMDAEDHRTTKRMKLKKRKFTEKHFGTTTAEQIELCGRLIYHLLVQMNQLEMKAVCLLCGHYPLLTWGEPFVKRFNKEFSDTKAFAGTEAHYVRKTPKVGADHAGKWETSYLWYLRPDCVDMSIYLGREHEEAVAVCGEDPRTEASVEIGRKGCDIIVEGMIRKAGQLIERA